MQKLLISLTLFAVPFAVASASVTALLEGEECMSCEGQFTEATESMVCIDQICNDCRIKHIANPPAQTEIWGCHCKSQSNQWCELSVEKNTSTGVYSYQCADDCSQSCENNTCIEVFASGVGHCDCVE